MWMFVSFMSAAYVFGGIAVVYFATLTGNPLVVGAACIVWLLNCFLLRYANKKW